MGGISLIFSMKRFLRQFSKKATAFFQSRVPGIRNLSMGTLVFLFITVSLITRDPISTLLMIPVLDLAIEWAKIIRRR
jgi:hypothetical protein